MPGHNAAEPHFSLRDQLYTTHGLLPCVPRIGLQNACQSPESYLALALNLQRKKRSCGM